MMIEDAALRAEIEHLRQRLIQVEEEVSQARQDAHQARQETLQLRDALAAAQRDQQDLKSARAQLSRIRVRGLLGRIFNWH